ncbi:MAG: helix-turn-helix domain-containing protein [bacterium]
MEIPNMQFPTIQLPVQTSLHAICPYSPNCPQEVINPLIRHLSKPLQEVIKYLLINHQAEQFSVSSVVDGLGIPMRKLERIFSYELSCTPTECLARIRIYHVYKQLNENPVLSFKEAFIKAGFKSRAAFEYARKKYSIR